MPSIEKRLEKKLIREIERLHGRCVKFWPMSISGFPDRICLLPGGRIRFVELKDTGVEPENKQKAWHRKLRNLGFMVFVIDSDETLENFISTL